MRVKVNIEIKIVLAGARSSWYLLPMCVMVTVIIFVFLTWLKAYYIHCIITLFCPNKTKRNVNFFFII